jgi:hypothetical protein
MILSFHLTGLPIAEPVSLAQIKQQCRVDASFTNDDAILTLYGIAAREYAEKYTRRAFFPQSWRMTLDHFPVATFSPTVNPAMRNDWMFFNGVYGGMTIALPRPRCLSVQSIGYADQGGAAQIVPATGYYVDRSSEPARIVPTAGFFWPTATLYQPGSVKVDFISGSYAKPITAPEAFTVPSSAPFTYAPRQTPVGIVGVTDASGNDVSYTFDNGEFVFSSSQAGSSCSANYYVSTLPQSIALSILMLASHWYNCPEAANPSAPKSIPFGVAELLDLYAFECPDLESVV